ncbi:asparagine synthase [Cordyceps fumosorosea ARSEF 2679]|uniref:Asparagine synthase n=1 Tax=Cordyceps fumosorosea (strain ARSEF 2679) TaxID=1081104 RepID=A0A168BS60_CORFA|nr:asparagine synthase [Cordyceps fumosorosea ARSEF 2679]OAA70478.1 asparagine synthase [Cordyceps fumosorosea ARSEF 2679]
MPLNWENRIHHSCVFKENSIRKPPGPRPLPIVGNRYELYPDVLGSYDQLLSRYGPVIKTINFGTTIYHTNDTAIARHVLREDAPFCSRLTRIHFNLNTDLSSKRRSRMKPGLTWSKCPFRCECVVAARDRHGIKPLVYAHVGEKILDASEAKAFLPLGWKPRWDVNAISGVGWMFDDRTLFRGVKKVLPGHYLEITREGGVEKVKYWDAEYEDKVSIVTDLARKEHVKIGNDQATQVTYFSVAFPEKSGYDESRLGIAEPIADWLGVKTIKKSITEENLTADFADAVFHREHHHFDLNFVAKYALSTLPQEHGVKMVLIGELARTPTSTLPATHTFPPPDGALPDSILSRHPEPRERMSHTVEREMQEV